MPRNSYERFQNEQTERTEAAIGEMARLLGDSAPASIDAANYVGSWWDLQRHMRFSKSQDWRDIAERDWPEVRAEITAIALGDGDPLPVPDIDLGQAASGRLTGSATLALPWERLDADGFERLLYDLLRSIPEHENVQWLMQTRAPDRGRDLSLDRVLRDGSGGVRTERVILQAKHWLSKSVNAAAVSETATAGKLWSPRSCAES